MKPSPNPIQLARGLALVCLLSGALLGCTDLEFTQGGGGAGGSGSPQGGGGGAAEGGRAPSTGGAAPTTEVCGNGIDDEGDGFVDCQDPECTAFCNEVPEGWTGFVSPRADGCLPSESLVQRGFTSASGENACTCACAGSPSCFLVQATAYGGGNCGGGASPVALMQACATVGSPGSDSLKIDVTGTCPGAPSAELIQPTPTSTSVDLCNDPAGSCVFAPGTMACPSGFPISQFYQGTLSDTRTCSAAGCICTPKCGEVASHQNPDCTDAGTSLPFGSCVNDVGPYLISFDENAQACVPAGNASGSGTVSLADPLTVCCR